MPERSTLRRRVVVLVALAVVLCATVPATAAAQSSSQVGGTVTVSEGETVDSLEAFAGTVVVEGTVTGDVSAAAGDIRIHGDVGGDVEAAGGSVTIAGTVDGDVQAASGSLEITDGATVGGDLSAGAGSATVDGVVDGDVAIGADTIRLGDEAAIAGDLRYGGDLVGNTGAVAGDIRHDSSLGGEFAPTLDPIVSWVFSLYVLALNLLIGAALLALFPRFSAGVSASVATDPVRTGLVGLGVLVGVPILLIALAITVVGIPLSFVGGFAFALAIWIAIIYGRFAVAAWLLSAVGVGNRWIALVVGLVAGAAVVQIPYLGTPINLIVLLLGLGALARGVYGHRRALRDRDREPGVRPEETPTD
ncbi:polymer-forming cytoskeletal protein [Natrarchaeobius halalkaliphilus]|uniref:Polymer-forming cytoskeletal protein n=1 Tax=Natrarchaeobius halalkaliphilus TaxID=1679091 RepID=A0A3N6LPQ5_9EURY|nr:polymer-forming cytoskeletal protein [Natrarchaeobius halalkaliphilus]RQG90157.1 polymer-forming cytoskeletal protein [Natrarchaeobius halalkaliphilus]